MNVKERVLLVASSSPFSKQDFFEKLGITYRNFIGANKKTPLNSTVLSRLVTEFGIDAHWLLTGEGSPEGLKQLMGAENQIAFLEKEDGLLRKQHQDTRNYLNSLENQRNDLSQFIKLLKE